MVLLKKSVLSRSFLKDFLQALEAVSSSLGKFAPPPGIRPSFCPGTGELDKKISWVAGIRSLKKIFPGIAGGRCTQLELTETLCLDIELLVPSLFFLDVWPRLCRFPFFPIIEKYSLYIVFHSASDQSEFPDSVPRAEQAPSRGGLPSILFRKITQQYILPLEYANSANSLLLESISQLDDLSETTRYVSPEHVKENPSRGSFGESYTLETRL